MAATYEQTDFSQAKFGARSYLERIGVLDAARGPAPTVHPASWRVHRQPLVDPQPPAALKRHLLGEDPPDRGETQPWP